MSYNLRKSTILQRKKYQDLTKKIKKASKDQSKKGVVSKSKLKPLKQRVVAKRAKASEDKKDAVKAKKDKKVEVKDSKKETGKRGKKVKSGEEKKDEVKVPNSSAVKDAQNTDSKIQKQPSLRLDINTLDTDVVFSFDTTGSMSGYLNAVRKNVSELVERLLSELPGIKIGIINHGSYRDGPTRVLQTCDLTRDKDNLVNFIKTSPSTGGDGWEAYEYVLSEVQKMSWRDVSNKILVMIGDANPSDPNDTLNRMKNYNIPNPRRIDWKEEVVNLRNKGVRIHSVVCGSTSEQIWPQMAEGTGGKKLSLENINQIISLVLAVCYREGGNYDQFVNYAQELEQQKGVDKHTMNLISELMVIDQGIFIHGVAPSKKRLMDLVKEQGLKYQLGNGYYEFTKKETVQSYKGIVLMDKNDPNKLWEGDQVRRLLGLPIGEDKVIDPSIIKKFESKYRFLIQSNNAQRLIPAGDYWIYKKI